MTNSTPMVDAQGGNDRHSAEYFESGAQLARSVSATLPRSKEKLRRADKRERVQAFVRGVAAHRSGENTAWILDNLRLLRATERDAAEFFRIAHRLPATVDGAGCEQLRLAMIADRYLEECGYEFHEEGLSAFIEGYQKVTILRMKELWELKPAVGWKLLDRLLKAPAEDWPVLVKSLQRLEDTNWRELFRTLNQVDDVLAQDPAAVYSRMDFESCESYRKVVDKLARHSPRSEREIAEEAVALSRRAAAVSDGSRALERRAHVGYYLVRQGLPDLEAAIAYKPPLSQLFPRWILRHPTQFYLISIELLTFLIVFGMLSGLDSLTPIFAGLVLLFLPATQAALDFVNNLVTSVLSPNTMPKFDFSEGIPDDCVTLVAVPALLLNEAQVQDLVLDLEIRFLANTGRNLYFALVTDSPDSEEAVDHRDTLADLAVRLIEGLNARYRGEGRSPFLLLHRHRVYNESEGRWMGWERKRGKLMDLNRILRGGFDAFPVKVGDVSIFPRVRYVITLDSDTQLPRDSAAHLVGAIAHPLNQGVVDPRTRKVVEGYGILQPRIGISIQSATRSRLASLYSGQTGFDIYTRAYSDVYQDLFGEGIFTGKGIYEVDVLREALEDRFPDNALLSHDLLEGAYARAGLVSDVELIDDYPSHFSSYNRRKHRWMRGDWQILRWLLPRVPDPSGRLVPNTISLISQWKIFDNLRRSLFDPSLLLLFVGSWLFLPKSPGYWTAAAVAVLFLPTYARTVFAVFRLPKGGSRALGAWLRDTAKSFAEGNAMAFLALIFLVHQALLSMDAIARSVVRVWVTRRKLLEWETAAEAEAAKGPKATVDTYLEWTPWIALGIGIAVRLLRPAALPATLPIIFLWIISPAVSGWLNRRPGTGHCKLNDKDTRLLSNSAERVYRYFRDWSTPATHWLIPDSVRENGAADLRLSPTNLGMLLNARIGGVHLGLVPLAEFIFETRQTLDCVLSLRKHRGHLFNWYDIRTLETIEPVFVSTVDSGNLAASLWTLKQASLAFATEPAARRGVTKEMAEELRGIANVCDQLVREMDFGFLYDRRKSALSIGFDLGKNRREAACYDLLASEARIAYFVGIAKGDVPQRAWLRLGRTHTLARGERILLSWTGTMFEYLMPALWMRHYDGTITEQSIRVAVRAQRDYGRRKGVPWGISESACLGTKEGDYGYAPFGIPDLAMWRAAENLVISPYSSFLALAVDPSAVAENLRQMEEFGWTGRYGFFEAIEYTRGGAEPIRSWMAHHQGMSLLAIVNLLHSSPLQQYFHSEPQVMATELLLHERLPSTAVAEPVVTIPELAPAEG
ncbi:MAG: hypothetical protein JO323_06825 [Acidobacteriia bacterium]|nr:hypothetical protein [Terriglobia bacterium]